MEKEIDFQLSSILPVKSCKIGSHSYTSSAKHCTVSYLLNSIFLLSMQNHCFFNSSNVPQEMEFHMLPELNIVQSITSNIMNAKPVFSILQMCSRKWNFKLVVHFQQNHVQQEMQFLIDSPILEKSCKISIFCIIMINAKPVLLIIPFPMWNRKWISKLVVYSQ